MNLPPLHPDLDRLSGLVGVWTGPGTGSYPTIENFAYVETLTFSHVGKPFLFYSQATRDPLDARPLHSETGYIRLIDAERVELVLAQPTGVVEVDEGTLRAASDGAVEIVVSSRLVGLSSSAKTVAAVQRTLSLDGGVLRSTLAMAAVGVPMTHHLASQLTRSTPEP